jgi:hypothetical protein
VPVIGDIKLGPPMAQIAKLTPRDKLSVEVTWKEGLRRGKTDVVDLSPLIKSFKFYKPLLKPAVFATARLDDDGHTVVWDGGIDMSAMSIERLAEESMNAAEFRAFMKTLDLTQEQAAALLGYGRRQVAHYLAGTKPIPRIVALACRRLIETRSDNKEFMISWSSEQDATAALLTRAISSVTIHAPLPQIAPTHLRTQHGLPQTHILAWEVNRSAVRYGT